jgi:uncharacterized membrane protein
MKSFAVLMGLLAILNLTLSIDNFVDGRPVWGFFSLAVATYAAWNARTSYKLAKEYASY